MKLFFKIWRILFELATQLISISVVLLFFYPIAFWYFKERPILGIDFFNTVSLVTILTKNLVLPPQAWLSNWFNGFPFVVQYPVLHFYAIVPFTFFMSVLESTKVWMIVTSGLSFIGMYLLFSRLSGSKLLAIVLAIGAIYSVGIYGALIWGGGLPYYATQAFYPWVLLYIVNFIKDGKTRYFWAAVLLSGLAVWGHPQAVLVYIVPTAFFLLIFGSSQNYPLLKFKKKFGFILLYGLLVFLIALPLVYPTFIKALAHLVVIGGRDSAISTLRLNPQESDVVAFHRAQPWRIYIDTNPIVFVAFAAAVIAGIFGFLLKPRWMFFREVLPYILLAGGYIFYINLYAYDISIYHGGWYRLFWTVPIWMGMATSVLWHELGEGLRLSFFKKVSRFLGPIFAIIATIVIYNIGMSLPLLTPVNTKSGPYWELVDAFSTQKLEFLPRVLYRILPSQKVQEFIDKSSSEGRAAFSSAYPPGINSYLLDGKLQRGLLPQFLKNADAKKYRLYSGDATFNIAWSVYSDISIARGYLDPPITDVERGYLFWLDAAVTVDPSRGGSSLVTAFKYPENVAKNHALFLLDWNGIRYLQGGGGSSYSSPINGLVDTTDQINRIETVDINNEYPVPIIHQDLRYIELKKELISPIVVGSNAQVVGVVGSESGYEAVVRSLASTNLNSQNVIPLNLGKYLDKISESNLDFLDTLILYDYDYQNKIGFKRVSEFVKKGGRVFIESGVETKESDNRKEPTPEIFPFETLVREGIGRQWDFNLKNLNLSEGVELTHFSPPLFDDAQWKIAYPKIEKARSGVEIWMTYQGKPVLTESKMGQGKIVWSGLNMFYHVTRFNNLDEGIFMKNILNTLIEIPAKAAVDTTLERLRPGQLKVGSRGAKGILFKEELYPGWLAEIKSNGKTQSASWQTKIYKAGPTAPGFMYVPIPTQLKNSYVEVVFTYWGSAIMWSLLTLAFLICVYLIDASLLNGLVLGRFSHKAYLFLKAKGSRWWEKEDEDSA